ncbi:activating signal cointegrator 1 complex subunit [Bulinus truncatus]|nr:activating signal cointegrator 1 complex subunit [Bulinus truncatus]
MDVQRSYSLLTEVAGNDLFFHHLEDTDHGSINRYLSGLGKSLMELEMSYCLEVGEDNRTITPLTLGRIASYYHLKHGTMRMFRDSLSQHCTIPELTVLSVPGSVSLPQIEVKVEVKGWLARVGQDRTKEVDITYSGGVRPESCWLPVHADQEYVFTLRESTGVRQASYKSGLPRSSIT